MVGCILGVGGTLNCDIPPAGLLTLGNPYCSTCFTLSVGNISGQGVEGALTCEVLSSPSAGSKPCQKVCGPLSCKSPSSTSGILAQGSDGSSNCGSPPSGAILITLNFLYCMG